jgi:hypothetical protein
MLVRRRLPMMVTPKVDLRRIQVSVICSLLGYLNQNFRDSMFDFLVLIISKSRVLFDEYSAACIQASQLASSTLQSVDVGICDLNKLIADTTQLLSGSGGARRVERGAHGRRRSRCDWREGVHGVHLHVLRRSLARSIRSTPTPRRAPSS